MLDYIMFWIAKNLAEAALEIGLCAIVLIGCFIWAAVAVKREKKLDKGGIER